jgi:hypothetical protein
MNIHEKFQETRINAKKDFFNCGKKNAGGAAFNIVSLNYDKSKDGDTLANLDNDAMVRALMRSKVLDKKNNGGYNILTGTSRPAIPVPSHERYNPISNAASAVMSNNGSQRS